MKHQNRLNIAFTVKRKYHYCLCNGTKYHDYKIYKLIYFLCKFTIFIMGYKDQFFRDNGYKLQWNVKYFFSISRM